MGCNSSAPAVSEEEEEAAEMTQMRMQMEHDMIQMSLGTVIAIPNGLKRLDTVEKVIAFQARSGNRIMYPPTWLYFWDKSVCPTWEGWWLTPSVGSDSHIVFAPGQGKNVLRAGRWYCGPENVEVKTFTVASRTGEQLVGVYGPGGMPGNGVYQEQPGHPHTSGIGSGRPVYKRIRPLSPDEWEACREKNGRIPPWKAMAPAPRLSWGGEPGYLRQPLTGSTGKDGATPLLVACMEGDVDEVFLLLKNGADVNRAMVGGITPLLIACGMGDVDAVWLLLENGAEVDRADKDGRTPLWKACCENEVDAARLLLEKGAAVDRATEEGATPLYIACDKGHVDAVRLLLDKGAEVDRAVKKGQWKGATPLLIACYYGRVDAARLLLDKGAVVDRAPENGATPLYIACQEGHVDAARLLLDNGAEVDRATKRGATPLAIAKSKGHSSIAALLEHHVEAARPPNNGAARREVERARKADRAREAERAPRENSGGPI